MPLVASLPLAFLSTAFALHWWQLPHYPVFLWTLLGFVGFFGFFGFQQNQYCRLLFFTTSGIVLGFLIIAQHNTHPADSIDQYADGTPVTIEGSIALPPQTNFNRTVYTLDVQTMRRAETGAVMPAQGMVHITTFTSWPVHPYGSVLKIRGKLEPLSDDGYGNYLAMQGIRARMKKGTIISVSPPSGTSLLGTLATLRGYTERRITLLYPEPAAALLIGLLTGSRGQLSDRLEEHLKRTGLTHIVAISGSNITIILTSIGWMLFFLPLRWKFGPSVIGIILFTFFVGASASVVRAAIMGILGLLALQTGRLKDTRLAILWTAFLMVLWNPATLWYDAGFQLSFFAVIGLCELNPILQPLCKRLPAAFGMRDALITTIAASSVSVPWATFRFGTFSFIAPLANILVLPFIPLAMLFGFIGLMTSFVAFPLGRILAVPGSLLLELMVSIITALGALPFAALENTTMPLWILLLYYIFLSVVIVYFRPSPALPPVQKDSHLPAQARDTQGLLRHTTTEAEGMRHDDASVFQLLIKRTFQLFHQRGKQVQENHIR